MSDRKRPLASSDVETASIKRRLGSLDAERSPRHPAPGSPTRSTPSSMQHAPATSHGTYLGGIIDEVEDLENYTEDGYHPVHLGDCLGVNDRYRVIHKLGHGGFATVWLCRDIEKCAYVAVKVHVASVIAEDMMEDRLAALPKDSEGAAHLALPIDRFKIKGPNGTHECLVFKLLGPPVSPDLWLNMEDDPGPILRRMSYQATLALDYLHRNDICHGDFRPANILVQLANLDHLNEEEMLSLFGQPRICTVHTESGEELPASSSRYLVSQADVKELPRKYLLNDICVIDFSESYPISSPPVDLGTPKAYLPPEMLLEFDQIDAAFAAALDESADSDVVEDPIQPQEQFPVGIACDRWALGCTLVEIRQQQALFYMMDRAEDILKSTYDLLGPFPDHWMHRWASRAQYFNEHGQRRSRNPLQTLDRKLAHVLDFNSLKTLSLPKEEQGLFKDLLLKLFEYEPEKRASTGEVRTHEWFRL